MARVGCCVSSLGPRVLNHCDGILSSKLFQSTKCRSGSILQTSSRSISCGTPCFSVNPDPHETFRAEDVSVTHRPAQFLKKKPPVEDLFFGKHFTDHMLRIPWTEEGGWERPAIEPFANLSLHPGAKVLHYAVGLFEGTKCYRAADKRLLLFRPDLNMARMNQSAQRAALPTFDGQELIHIMKKLIRLDQSWVPHAESSSLYVRPYMIADDEILRVEQPSRAQLLVILSPTGPYFSSGYKPVRLLADPQYVRAWPGGSGNYKVAANYAPTLSIQKDAMKRGFAQVLWLYGEERLITEVGAMNIMIVLRKEGGGLELVTPPLNGLILPGVTRYTLLDLARQWGEFDVSEREITMKELEEHANKGSLVEMFGCGTAAVVCPVGSINYEGREIVVPQVAPADSLCAKFFKTITDIQYGRVAHPWTVDINA